ncbi:hypothetical protein [Nonomuraea soli]|uniref:DUF4367 domain-containing protein n=1 Tax=Nonomuraea soli TaxID=1032476 RepID=A0A7W0CTY6_9ACTN|nr:hypothetical protein [Nonomuraea soli]MBA2897119.1 hypothetical protein [Nonomuraea soli]
MDSDDFGDLERELLALGDSLEVTGPPPAEVASAVRARLQAPDPAHDAPASPAVQPERPVKPLSKVRRWQLVAAVVVLALALTAAAVVWVLRSTGVEIRVNDPSPSPTVTREIPGARSADLEEAARQVGFTPKVPAALGEPSEILVGDGRVVSMFWDHVRLDQFAGGVSPMFVKQLGGPEWPEEVLVNGAHGWWIAEAHNLTYVTKGNGETTPLRVADSTLVWGDDVTGYRLEGVKTLQDAHRIATSLR